MRKNEPDFPFDEPEFKEAWQEWMQYRSERRLPAYKPTGLKRTFAGIHRDSNGDYKTAVKIIHNSIEKNWQGLFPLKENGTHKQINESTNGQRIGTSNARIDALRNW